MVPAIRTSLAAAALSGLLLAGAASAQSGPSLPTMPMPPSYSDPAPKEAAKAKRSRPAQARKRDEAEGDLPASDEAPRRAASRKAGTTSADRPSRYVPEEFDRDGAPDGSRARPFMSESGRPGMGMRF